MPISNDRAAIIKRCQKSVTWFLSNFGKVKHPLAGIIPFDIFSYQKVALDAFRKYRFNIFKKCIAAGSPVWTPSGHKPIEFIRGGDEVLAYDETTKQIVTSVVNAAWCNGVRDTVRVMAEDHGSICTIDHQYLTTTGWNEARDLTGLDLIGYDGSAVVTRKCKGWIASGEREVYDLEIDKHHNFIVDGTVVHNCRQAGVSKISGAFALWYAMFHNNKTILIISRTDEDAMGFLREQIMFLFNHLPQWMQDQWAPVKRNDHELVLPNGSRIKSLTSHPDVMRSNSSSLNIIDESAFIQHMDVLWAGGYPTLNMGGSVIVISTTNGVGNWYWSTMTDAEAGVGMFHPIIINWWDMDWAIQCEDPLSHQMVRIAPRDGLVKCDNTIINDPDLGDIRLDPVIYGPWWSPWLERQYRALQEQGEAWKFEQEVLAQFVGSGNTVLNKMVIAHIQETVVDPPTKILGNHTWVHPVTGEQELLSFDFRNKDEGLWVWAPPVGPTPGKKKGNKILERGEPAHTYVAGIDIASGRGKDYSTIEVFDTTTQEQVAEFMARVLPRELIRYADRICRWYNTALMVVERNNGGDIVIDELRNKIMYPKLWRKKEINDKPQPQGSGRAKKKQRALKVGMYGFMTSQSSKQLLNKVLIDLIRDKDGEGYTIYSKRLLKQINTYVRKRDKSGRETYKTEAEDGANNFDDLVMATALALYASFDCISSDISTLLPSMGTSDFRSVTGPAILSPESKAQAMTDFVKKGGATLLMPMNMTYGSDSQQASIQQYMDDFTMQLGAVPVSGGKPIVQSQKYFYTRE